MENYRAGLIAAILYNQNRRKGAKAMEPLDFFGGKPKKQIETATEIKNKLMTWAGLVSRK